MVGGSQSFNRTPMVYRKKTTQGTSGYRRSYRKGNWYRPARFTYARRRYVQNIPRYIKRNKVPTRKLQVYDEEFRDIVFNNNGVSRLLNGIALGNKKSDRQSDKIVVKGIKLIGNVQLGPDAKEDHIVQHVLFFIVSDNAPSETVPLADKIFIGVGEGNPETWVIDPDSSDRFKLLRKLKYKLSGAGGAEQCRHGLETIDRYVPVDVWTDYKDTLIGNVGSIQKGALYLVSATVSGKACRYTLRCQMYFKTV